MMSKRNIALFFLLLLQLIIIAYVYRPGKEVAPPEKVFFQNVVIDQVVQLALSDDEEKTVVLSKTDGSWNISSHDGIPVQSEKITALLTKLMELKSDRLVTRTKSSHQRFKVGKNYNQKVSLTLFDNRVVSIYFGTSPSHQTMHVRAEEDPNVYLVHGISAWELSTDPGSWWQSLYVDFGRDNLAALAITNKNGQIHLVKGGEGKWQVEGQPEFPLDEGAVQSLIDKVRRISVSEYLGKEERKEFGLAQPEAVLVLEAGEERVEVKVGSLDAETATRVIKSSSSPFYVRVGQYSIDALLAQKLGELRAP